MLSRGTPTPEGAVRGLVVHKYGGTSVGTPERIRAVAARVARARRAGQQLVVVVSAMGQTTDQLIELARQVHPRPPQREMDMLLTAGERISMALLAMALRTEDIEAISFTGSQSGIITDSAHGQARILEVRCDRIRSELARDRVVIVAGFQGVSREREVTTLGRGGSDTSAVALAGSLGALRCEIYTDVPGVMSADPRAVPGANLLPHLHSRTALTLTSLGAGVLIPRAARLGYTLRIPIHVRSSWDDGPGTRIDQEEGVEANGPLAVTKAAPVALVEMTAEALAALESLDSLQVLAWARDGSGAKVRAALADPDGESLEARLGGVPVGSLEVLGRGELVSVVTHGPLRMECARRATARTAASGIPVLGTFAGPGHVSLLVPAGQGDRLMAELHAEFLES